MGTIEDSKVIQEFSVEQSIIKSADKISFYISSSFNGKLKGYIAACNNRNILIYNLEGQVF